MSRGHRREGSYINKSLLTLGTVIHKMSDRGAIHIPFRDSKLTRLLQSSLSGNGAKVAIICTVTPASMQAEETHNTLKFASRAKKVGSLESRPLQQTYSFLDSLLFAWREDFSFW